jgi:hypothetical protein
MSTTLTPVSQIGKTILGITRELEASSGITPVYDTQSTLNAKYNVVPSLTPTAFPGLVYFGIGIGGCYNVSNTNLQQPYPVQQTNMDLYQPIPFRCVPVEQDLTPTERAPYRMRVRKTINGADYFCYYLKLLTYAQSTVSVTTTNPTTGLMTPYVLNYADLNPTPPVVNSNGTITPSTTELNVSVTTTLPVTGAEVTESINVLYNGDLRYATISEIGLYSGQDQTAAGLDVNGNAISYLEAILAQLNIGYTWNGDDFSNPNRSTTYSIALGTGDLLLM